MPAVTSTRRTGWVIGLFAAVLAVSGGIVVVRGADEVMSSPRVEPTPVVPRMGATGQAPVVTHQPAGPLLAGAGDDVVHLQAAAAVYRVELATGQVTRTPTPVLVQFGSYVAGPGWVVVKMVDSERGVVIRDGQAARPLPAGFRQVGRLSPAPDGDLWFQPEQPSIGMLRSQRYDVDGRPVPGQTIVVPARWGSLRSDGTGQLLQRSAGGSYRVTPAGTRLLTRGYLLAVGAHHLLVWDCDARARCGAYRLDRRTDRRSLLPAAERPILQVHRGLDPSELGDDGELSPDGRQAALQVPDGHGSYLLHVVDLRTGAVHTLPGTLTDENGNAQLGWTRNGRWLLAITDHRFRAYDVRSGATRTLDVADEQLLHLTLLGATGN